MWLFPLSPSLITSGTAARWQISDCLYELMPALWRWQSAIIESSGMTVRSRHPALSWRPHGDCQHRRCLRCLGRGQDKSCLPTATWSVKLINSNELGMVRKYATAVSDRSLVRSLVPRTAGKLEHTQEIWCEVIIQVHGTFSRACEEVGAKQLLHNTSLL